MKPLRLKTGDWVAFPVITIGDDEIAQIREVDRVKLPASPADMAKSHRLLMRWWRSKRPLSFNEQQHVHSERVNCVGPTEVAMSRHCAKISRLTTKQSRRGGKGKRHVQ